MIKIAASIASGPLTDLQGTLRELESAGADVIHFDVEDGSFVPAMTLGVKAIRDLRPRTGLPFDVHLMMVNPEWLIPQLADYGADRVSVHLEACPYPRRTLGLIVKHGMRAGLALNPVTPLPSIEFCLPLLSFVVLLSTEPETGEPAFLPSVLDKVTEARARAGLAGIEWVVDGGVNAENIYPLAANGVNMVVVGRAVFAGGAIRENLAALKRGADAPGSA